MTSERTTVMWIVTLNRTCSPSSVRPLALIVEVALNDRELLLAEPVGSCPSSWATPGRSGRNETFPVWAPVT